MLIICKHLREKHLKNVAFTAKKLKYVSTLNIKHLLIIDKST